MYCNCFYWEYTQRIPLFLEFVISHILLCFLAFLQEKQDSWFQHKVVGSLTCAAVVTDLLFACGFLMKFETLPSTLSVLWFGFL